MAPSIADNVQYVPPDSIQRMFNESQYPSMIAHGRLVPTFRRDDHLKEPETVGQPWCTRSQTIRYGDEAGQWLVVVHQYLRPDGTLGASGRPDPKRLPLGNTVFVVETPVQD